MIIDYLLTFFNRQSDRSLLHTCVEQTQGELCFPEASIEPVGELVKTFLQILARAPVVHAQQLSLEVTDSGDVVYPRQPFSGLFRRCGATIMVPCRGHDTQHRQDVGAERLIGEQAAHGKALDLLGADRMDRFNGDETRLLAASLHRHEGGRLAFRSPDAFASGVVPAEECLIHYHEALQSIDAISITHGLANIAQHAIGRDLGHPALVADHQLDRQQPMHQGQIGGMKLRARRHRGLMMVAPALLDLAGRHLMAVVVPACRGLKAIGPDLLLQRLCASFLGAEPLLPFHQIHRLGLPDCTSNPMNNWRLEPWR